MDEEPKYILPHDVSNAPILPKSKKSKENADSGKINVKKSSKPILSKKKQKKLRKILERKQKRLSRAEVLEKLSQHQVGQHEMNLFSSVARIQQKVPKRRLNESSEVQGVNTIAGSKRKKYLHTAVDNMPINRVNHSGPYFETDSSSSDEDDQSNSLKESKNQSESFEKSRDQSESCGESRDPAENSEHIKAVAEDTTEKLNSGEPEQNSEEKILSADDTTKPLKICLQNNETGKLRKPATFVPVNRKPEIEEARTKLPILGMEQEIMESINENPVVIICGATGSGKTTQVPQFLYEAGYCSDGKKIGVTEPRRVAAMSMSARVAEEMNVDSSIVSYQIRYEGNVTTATKIKFMTDGVLLRELKADFLLKTYSAVLIDEAHERSMYSDILIGLLSRVVLLRHKKAMPPLKLIIMSATLRVDDFLSDKLFGLRKPPVINVESRQFPVTTHFSRRTDADFLRESFRKCAQIHRKLPDGGILVFLPGQREVRTLCAWLKSAFPRVAKESESAEKSADVEESAHDSSQIEKQLDDGDEAFLNSKRKKKRKKPNRHRQKPVEIKLDDYKIDLNDTDAGDMQIFDENFDVSDQEAEEHEKMMAEFFPDESSSANPPPPLHVLPLYALLSPQNQSRVFEPPPANHRLCVVATNVAETSLTIPNVRYVVDSGREKIRVYDTLTGVSKFVTQWISKASAEQRTGRAGRTSPGHCYRLYSSAVFADFQQYAQPEILLKPIDDLVLIMKNTNIQKIHNFPFPTAPDRDKLKIAEERLCKLGALERNSSMNLTADTDELSKITPLGRTMALFPVSPAYSKMLALGHQQNLLPYVVCMVSALSVREPLINLSSLNTIGRNDNEKSRDDPDSSSRGPDSASNVGGGDNKEKLNSLIADHLKLRREWAGTGETLLLGDISVLLRAVLDAERNRMSAKFCDRHGLRQKSMLEIRKMRRQLTGIINGLFPDCGLSADCADLVPPANKQAHLLRQILLSGLANNIAKKRIDIQIQAPNPNSNQIQQKSLKNAYECSSSMSDPVFIHPTSVLRRSAPDFLLYQDIIDSGNGKKYMTTVSAIEPDWLPVAAKSYCNFGSPLDEPQPWYDPAKDTVVCKRSCSFGPIGWKLDDVIDQYPTNDISYYKYFAMAFLNGDVFNELKRYSDFLLSSANSMLKPWAKLQRRIGALLEALLKAGVKSKADLKAAWSRNKSFLRDEYCQWLPESKHGEIYVIWPPDD